MLLDLASHFSWMKSVLSNLANALSLPALPLANRWSAGERFKRLQLRSLLCTLLLHRFRGAFLRGFCLNFSFVLTRNVAFKAHSGHYFISLSLFSFLSFFHDSRPDRNFARVELPWRFSIVFDRILLNEPTWHASCHLNEPHLCSFQRLCIIRAIFTRRFLSE